MRLHSSRHFKRLAQNIKRLAASSALLGTIGVLVGTTGVFAGGTGLPVGAAAACGCSIPANLSISPKPIEFPGTTTPEKVEFTVTDTNSGIGNIDKIETNPTVKPPAEGYQFIQSSGSCKIGFVFGPGKLSCNGFVELINHTVGNTPTAELEITLDTAGPFKAKVKIK